MTSLATSTPDQLLDDDGYPTDEALAAIGSFTGTADELAAFLGSLMHYGSVRVDGFVDGYSNPAKRLTLVTGGWSGSESVVTALQETMFHIVGWESSSRGGKHTYTFTHGQWDSAIPWGKPTGPDPDRKAAMSQHNVTTETTGEYTEVTVDGLFRMTIVNGLATLHLANEDVHVERDEASRAMTIAPYHPRLAYVAPEARAQLRADLGL
jgi:hypothetical protein